MSDPNNPPDSLPNSLPNDGIPMQKYDNQLYDNEDISIMLTDLKRSKENYTDYKLKDNPKVIDKIIYSIGKDERLKIFIDRAIKYILELHKFTTRELEMNDRLLKEIESLKSQITSKSSNATQYLAVLNGIFARLKEMFNDFIDSRDENLKNYSEETRRKATAIKNLIKQMETQFDEKELSNLLSLIHSFMMDEKSNLIDRTGETIKALNVIDGLQFDSQKQSGRDSNKNRDNKDNKNRFRNPLEASPELGIPGDLARMIDRSNPARGVSSPKNPPKSTNNQLPIEMSSSYNSASSK